MSPASFYLGEERVMTDRRKDRIAAMLNKGVNMPNPEAVEVGEEVDIERISGEGVTIYPGCKLYGRSTLICRGATLGYEAPVTVQDAYIGPDVQLKGGFFKKAVFLEGAEAGAGAHVREGTILEESANVAHTVGLKQTILFPFVTLGSLINFCDILMAGGTSRKDHSEVGSSYIHFNYTPNQDKATASLLGDVPNGVMLNQRPIFLGGQGGLVGPCRLAFGTVIAAGSIYRKDETRADRLIIAGGKRDGNVPFSAGVYRNVQRIVMNNLRYMGNLYALMQWYRHVRPLFVGPDFPEALHKGLIETLGLGIAERRKRLNGLSEKMGASIERYQAMAGEHASDHLIHQKKALHERWSAFEAFFDTCTDEAAALSEGDSERDAFLGAVSKSISENGKRYVPAIQGLPETATPSGVRWLSGVVENFVAGAVKIVPELGPLPESGPLE